MCLTTFDDLDDTNFVEYAYAARFPCSRQRSMRELRAARAAGPCSPRCSRQPTEPPRPAAGAVRMAGRSADGWLRRYRTAPSGTWKPALFEQSVVEQLMSTQFGGYCKKVQESDCAAEMKRLMAKGPPVWVNDPHGLPVRDDTPTVPAPQRLLAHYTPARLDEPPKRGQASGSLCLRVCLLPARVLFAVTGSAHPSLGCSCWRATRTSTCCGSHRTR